MTGLVTAWLAEVVLITYRSTKKGGNQGTAQVPFPLPSQFAGTFIIFGSLALLPQSAGNFASLAGWGLVAATFLNLYNPLGKGQTTPTVAATGTKNALGNTAQ
jgi:hypothetical protein